MIDDDDKRSDVKTRNRIYGLRSCEKIETNRHDNNDDEDEDIECVQFPCCINTLLPIDLMNGCCCCYCCCSCVVVDSVVQCNVALLSVASTAMMLRAIE